MQEYNWYAISYLLLRAFRYVCHGNIWRHWEVFQFDSHTFMLLEDIHQDSTYYQRYALLHGERFFFKGWLLFMTRIDKFCVIMVTWHNKKFFYSICRGNVLFWRSFLGSGPEVSNPSLKAQIPASRLKSQPRGSNPSLEAQIPASRLKS